MILTYRQLKIHLIVYIFFYNNESKTMELVRDNIRDINNLTITGNVENSVFGTITNCQFRGNLN